MQLSLNNYVFTATMQLFRILTLTFIVAVPCLASANGTVSLALAAAEDREFDRAIEQLASITDDRLAAFHLARLQLRTGEAAEAEETLEALLEQHPDYADGHYLMGLVQLTLIEEVSLFKKLGKAKASMNAWRTTVELEPGHIDAHFAMYGWYAMAPGIAGGDLEEAERRIPELEAMHAGYGALARAMLHTRRKNNEAAEAAYLKAVELMQRAGPHFSIAQHYLARERWQDALSHIEQYEQKEKRWWDPDITVAHLVKARAHAGLGNVEQAEQIVATALALKPNRRIRALLKETLESL